MSKDAEIKEFEIGTIDPKDPKVKVDGEFFVRYTDKTKTTPVLKVRKDLTETIVYADDGKTEKQHTRFNVTVDYEKKNEHLGVTATSGGWGYTVHWNGKKPVQTKYDGSVIDYDKDGHIATITLPDGTKFEYDAEGNVKGSAEQTNYIEIEGKGRIYFDADGHYSAEMTAKEANGYRVENPPSELVAAWEAKYSIDVPGKAPDPRAIELYKEEVERRKKALYAIEDFLPPGNDDLSKTRTLGEHEETKEQRRESVETELANNTARTIYQEPTELEINGVKYRNDNGWRIMGGDGKSNREVNLDELTAINNELSRLRIEQGTANDASTNTASRDADPNLITLKDKTSARFNKDGQVEETHDLDGNTGRFGTDGKCTSITLGAKSGWEGAEFSIDGNNRILKKGDVEVSYTNGEALTIKGNDESTVTARYEKDNLVGYDIKPNDKGTVSYDENGNIQSVTLKDGKTVIYKNNKPDYVKDGDQKVHRQLFGSHPRKEAIKAAEELVTAAEGCSALKAYKEQGNDIVQAVHYEQNGNLYNTHNTIADSARTAYEERKKKEAAKSLDTGEQMKYDASNAEWAIKAIPTNLQKYLVELGLLDEGHKWMNSNALRKYMKEETFTSRIKENSEAEDKLARYLADTDKRRAEFTAARVAHLNRKKSR